MLPMSHSYDITIIGAGFSGSLLAAIAARLGMRVLLIERQQHPRFAIGESTSPLANLLLEELAVKYNLPLLKPLCNWGSWQKSCPQIVGGLKWGFTYYAHTLDHEYVNSREKQLLVAASPNDSLADTHWMRSDVDTLFLQQALEAGVTYRDRTTVQSVHRANQAGLWQLHCSTGSDSYTVASSLVVDAGGPRGLLHRVLSLPSGGFDGYPDTQALFSHFEGVSLCEELIPNSAKPPYPPDNAAVHHLFDGGWIWMLRFRNGVVSAGASLSDCMAASIDIAADPLQAWGRLLHRLPTVERLFAHSKPVQPFMHLPRIAWRAAKAGGKGWALLPSAAASIDPLFSTGFPLALLGVQRIAEQLKQNGTAADFEEYGEITLQEADTTAEYVAACLRTTGHFQLFLPLTQFYFASASYSEVCHRIGTHCSRDRFLSAHNASFWQEMHCSIQSVYKMLAEPECSFNFFDKVRSAIEPINIAGLADEVKQNWYGVDLNDLVVNANKLGLTSESMKAILQDAEWAKNTETEENQ